MTDHGTRARYSAGCRCSECTEANRAYNRAYLDRVKRVANETGQPMYADRPHGRQETYNRGCRCELCRKVEAERHQRKRARAKLGVLPNPRVYPSVPLQPLLERLSSHLGERIEELSLRDVADAVGMSTRTVSRWYETGTVQCRHLDDIATRIGWHPAAIWGATWYTQTYDTGVNA